MLGHERAGIGMVERLTVASVLFWWLNRFYSRESWLPFPGLCTPWFGVKKS